MADQHYGEALIVTSDEVAEGDEAVPRDDIDEVALDEGACIVDVLALDKCLRGVHTVDLGGTHGANNDRDNIYREDPARDQRLSLIQASLSPSLHDVGGSAPHSYSLTK